MISFIPSDALTDICNSIDPDEMAPGGAISSGSMLFAILLMSSLKHPFSDQWKGPNLKIEESILETQG